MKKMEKDDNANNVLSSEQEPNTNDIIQKDGKCTMLMIGFCNAKHLFKYELSGERSRKAV